MNYRSIMIDQSTGHRVQRSKNMKVLRLSRDRSHSKALEILRNINYMHFRALTIGNPLQPKEGQKQKSLFL